MPITCLIAVVGGRAVITRISDVITITISLLSVWNQRTVIKDISKTCTDKRIKNVTTLQIHIPANALVERYSQIQGLIILCTALRAGGGTLKGVVKGRDTKRDVKGSMYLDQ